MNAPAATRAGFRYCGQRMLQCKARDSVSHGPETRISANDHASARCRASSAKAWSNAAGLATSMKIGCMPHVRPNDPSGLGRSAERGPSPRRCGRAIGICEAWPSATANLFRADTFDGKLHRVTLKGNVGCPKDGDDQFVGNLMRNDDAAARTFPEMLIDPANVVQKLTESRTTPSVVT